MNDHQLSLVCVRLVQHKFVMAVQKKDLEEALDIAVCSRNQFRALIIAIDNNCTELGKSLIKVGWDVNEERERDGSTPLHSAISTKNAEMVGALLANGANVGKANRNGYSPMANSVRMKMDAKALRVHEMLSEWADDSEFQNYNERGETLLHCLARNGVAPGQLFASMMAKGIDVNASDMYTGRNFIMDMSIFHVDQNKIIRVVSLAMRYGLNLNYADHYGNTFLHRLASEERVVVLRWAVGLQQIKIRVKNANGQTPLWIAAKRGNEEVIRLLYQMGETMEGSAIEYGGSTTWKSASEVARSKSHENIANLVEEELEREQPKKEGQRITSLFYMARRVIREELAASGVNIALKVNELNLPRALKRSLVTFE